MFLISFQVPLQGIWLPLKLRANTPWSYYRIPNFIWVLHTFVIVYQAFIASIESAPIDWATPVFEKFSFKVFSVYASVLATKRKKVHQRAGYSGYTLELIQITFWSNTPPSILPRVPHPEGAMDTSFQTSRWLSFVSFFILSIGNIMISFTSTLLSAPDSARWRRRFELSIVMAKHHAVCWT